MRRGWTKFWLCASVSLGISLSCFPAPAQRGNSGNPQWIPTLAGLRPGRDKLSAALKWYKAKYLARLPGGDSIKQWRDTCTGRSLTLHVDEHGVIREVTVSSMVPRDGSCADRRFDALQVQRWVTGRGLRLGDPQGRVVDLYGNPDSSGPSVQNGMKLVYLYYSFGGQSDVPQVMEVYCARDTGRVVEIVLARPSL